MYRVSNQAAGSGTLVAGIATLVTELKVSGNVVSTFRYNITLSNP
ncbi:hypothetical protein [Anaeromyxobacter oryzisoli]|nr:hypothetical protein [Anaeromyxobacter sp. SG63]